MGEGLGEFVVSVVLVYLVLDAVLLIVLAGVVLGEQITLALERLRLERGRSALPAADEFSGAEDEFPVSEESRAA